MDRRRDKHLLACVLRFKRLTATAAALALCACSPQGPPPAVDAAPPLPKRVVSLDYCADQFVLKLADRDQIAAVSPDAVKPFSYMRDAAIGAPIGRSTTEDVLARKPDLVVRSYGGGPNAQSFLERAGVPVAQLGFAEDFDGVRRNIRLMARALGHPARGENLIAELDARLRAAQSEATGATALYVTSGGVTTGTGSLVDVLMRAAGFSNFEHAPGWRPIPLERLAREHPDIVAAAFFSTSSASLFAWSAARHPVAQHVMTTRPVAALEGAWTACGGWFLVEAVETLAAQRRALEPAR